MTHPEFSDEDAARAFVRRALDDLHMNEDSLAVIDLLSFSPGGLDLEELTEALLWPTDSDVNQMVGPLLETGLARYKGDRLYCSSDLISKAVRTLLEAPIPPVIKADTPRGPKF